jgi:uncharacterized protein YcbK (DUF882 family)
MILPHHNSWYSYALLPAMFLAAVLSSSATAGTIAVAVGHGADDKRSIAFYHTHTGERLEVVYYSAGHYRKTALDQINHFLRDFRTGDMASVDPATIDIVHAVQQHADHQGEVHIVSAYRSKTTNEMLRRKGTGVARKSQHIEAKAIDFRLPGVDTAAIRDIARALKRGGVGYYRQSDFIHVDSGRVRFW